ncbi:Sua5/YciO/YrdC/YwlC family protein [Spiroplasma turonicum]|uniref:L-threonylcarbamoyladenylate synthase n=1 Tax=Spiroplasma turonicum TaxID=216946 RepID=A0A0K1P7J1_9MOLU|nr:Sua5/YciO/YrdC/YwlC family protein [Spiroplasma turonicum]AKU80154.1 tRNA threonylcarbamoyladenosine biosynthesis protein [Spiroplasma turonicum]ALX71154.1 tRNA threonylcarbamoyladenosine biosynthesis protein [Spiroplasma turonicum]
MKIENSVLNKKAVKEAVGNLLNNSIVILPTDTIYGLSSVVSLENARKINNIKKSNIDKKLIILISKLRHLTYMDIKIDKKIKNILMNSKEPTTILLKNKNNEVFGIRKPKRKDILKVINKTGPLFSTSVNYSGDIFKSTKKDLSDFAKENQIKCFFWVGTLNNKASKLLDSDLNIIRN